MAAVIAGIGSWTVEKLAFAGQGRDDQLPAGDVAYLELVSELAALGRRATEHEVRAFFAPYGEHAGLAGLYGVHARFHGRRGAAVPSMRDMTTKIRKSEEEWRDQLSPERYDVLRRKGTEPPFTGEYAFEKADGVYRCGACGAELFRSDAKFDSGTGWPSFTEPAVAQAIELEPDHSHGMTRTEVLCARCGSHLGHVFDDGPAPTGKRFCINSCALDLERS